MNKRPALFGLAVLGMLLGGCATGPRSDETGVVTGNDAELVKVINQRLSSDPLTSRHPVGFIVQDGVVTLEGSVPSGPARARILSVVRSTPGVGDVVDKLYGW